MANYTKHADEVFTRDNHTCRACGYYSEFRFMLTLDHIVPQSKGGPDKASNLQCLCACCNSIKSNKDTTFLPIREQPDMDMTLRQYEEMLLENRREFFTSIYGTASKGWFLRKERTLKAIDAEKRSRSQTDRLLHAVKKTFRAPNASNSWVMEKIKEYRNMVIEATPATAKCTLAY